MVGCKLKVFLAQTQKKVRVILFLCYNVLFRILPEFIAYGFVVKLCLLPSPFPECFDTSAVSVFQ